MMEEFLCTLERFKIKIMHGANGLEHLNQRLATAIALMRQGYDVSRRQSEHGMAQNTIERRAVIRLIHSAQIRKRIKNDGLCVQTFEREKKILSSRAIKCSYERLGRIVGADKNGNFLEWCSIFVKLRNFLRNRVRLFLKRQTVEAFDNATPFLVRAESFA